MTDYVAWDGKTYRGPPPPGWFQAADGRYWPPERLPKPSMPPPPAHRAGSRSVLNSASGRPHPYLGGLYRLEPPRLGPIGVRLLVLISVTAVVMVVAIVAVGR